MLFEHKICDICGEYVQDHLKYHDHCLEEFKKNNLTPINQQIGGNHYKQFKIQPVEFIHRNNIGFMEGNAIKYLCRYKSKGGIEDLRKAKHYIEMLIEMEIENADN